MSVHQLDDDLLCAVRSARPELSEEVLSPAGAEARTVLARVLAPEDPSVTLGSATPHGQQTGTPPSARVDDRVRAGRNRRFAMRLAIAADAAAAILVGALSFSSNDSPSGVQPAAAAVLRGAAAALDRGLGTILHTVMTESYSAGPKRPSHVTLVRASWLLQSHPYTCSQSGCPFVAYRQIDREPGAPLFESSTNARGITDLYNTATNTTYPGPPQILKNVYPQMLTPANMSSGINPSSPAFGDQFRALIESGEVRVIGDVPVDGQRTIAIVGHSRVPVGGRSRSGRWTWTYYVAPGSYRPVEFRLTGFGSTATTSFSQYQEIPARGHMSIFNLATQHPGARIDRSARDYQTEAGRTARRPIRPARGSVGSRRTMREAERPHHPPVR